MSQFWSLKCKNCGRWSSMEVKNHITESTFRCRFCNKSSKLKQVNEWGLANDSRGPFNHAPQAISTANRLNIKRQ